MGVPPLYKLEVGRRSQYCYTEEELKAAVKDLAPGSYHMQRFKVWWWGGGVPPMLAVALWYCARFPFCNFTSGVLIEVYISTSWPASLLPCRALAR